MLNYKNPADQSVKLQSGMYCHLYDNKLVINDVTTIEPRHLKTPLNKTIDTKVFQYVLNVILTIALVVVILWTSFFLLMPLFFLSFWHIRKLKQQSLPQNKSNCIPVENIDYIELVKGRLGFNYMNVFIDYNNKKSLKTLRLYDSESTFIQSKKLFEPWIQSIKENKKPPTKLSGIDIPLSYNEQYVLEGDFMYYTLALQYDPNKEDRYKYIRWIALFIFSVFVLAIVIKIVNYSNYVDFTVMVFFALLALIPLKYMQKAIPNKFSLETVKFVKEDKKHLVFHIKTKSWFLPLKLKFKKALLSEDLRNHLKEKLKFV